MREALSAAAGQDVSRETLLRIERYVELLTAAAGAQNLISLSTLDSVWDRHILDSAQLARFEREAGASWLDIGSGAGLPGIVIALIVEGSVTLVEPRRLRVEFLRHVVSELGVGSRVEVHHAKVERLSGKFGVITARAVAPLSRLFELSSHLSTKNTVWALPKGRNARTELVEAQSAWQGTFHVEQSVTDPDSYIVVARGVGKKP
jgi:16S rRNA (guanine527-N7)-methyltransferase